MNMENSDYKKEIVRGRKYAIEQFDKLMVFLSSGAIVLSIGFINNAIDLRMSDARAVLILSWISFIISLIFILISHQTSLTAMDKELGGKLESSDKYDKVTKILNWLSVISLFIGLGLLIIFISINI